MGDAQRKHDDALVEAPAIEAAPQQSVSDVDVAPVPSPAKALQSKLDQHFAERRSRFSGRFITWLVIGTCAGTWLTGVGLYATL